MVDQFSTNQIYLLMNEHSLSESNKNIISTKINNLINFMQYLNTVKDIDANLKNELLNINNQLAREQKITAKAVVRKNNALSKNLIKSMATQKENLLQVLEISQLRLEAELKKLNDTLNYPAVKTEQSFFNKLFSIFKVPFKSMSHSKNNTHIKDTRDKISLATSKLSSIEKRKEDLSKEFGCTGTEALRYLNKVTYNSFLPAYDTSISHLENLKNKITIINN